MVATILVLEDAESRIKKLRDIVPAHIRILWARNVREFLDMMHKPHEVVIFDHDLVDEHYSGAPSTDPTGADAARLYQAPANVTAIVWSLNPVGAQEILTILLAKNIPSAAVPFTRVEQIVPIFR